MIELKSNSGKLLINCANVDWTRLLLVVDGKTISLGADVFSKIKARLLNALESPETLPGFKNVVGVECRFVLTLFEMHHSIYLAEMIDWNDGLTLHVQNGEAQWVAQIDIDDSMRRHWIALLQAQTSVSRKAPTAA